MNDPFGKNLTDRDLVDNVLGGNTHFFGTIIGNTERLVAQIVFKMIPNSEDRKDIVQDIYIKAFHKLSGFKFKSKLSTWIAQIAYNNCLSWLGKKKLVFLSNRYEEDEHTLEAFSRQSPGSLTNETESIILRKELSSILQVEIDKLAPIYKTLITLYHAEDLSYQEIVEITGLPEGTIKSYLFRARKNLKENILYSHKKEDL